MTAGVDDRPTLVEPGHAGVLHARCESKGRLPRRHGETVRGVNSLTTPTTKTAKATARSTTRQR